MRHRGEQFAAGVGRMSTHRKPGDARAQIGAIANAGPGVRPELQPLHALAYTAPSRSAPRTGAIPRLLTQPAREVRVAYWRARQLIDAGWAIHALGEPIARYGFIAEVPCGKGETALVVFTRTTDGNVGAAHALANDMRRLSADHRDYLRRLLDALHGDVTVSKTDCA